MFGESEGESVEEEEKMKLTDAEIEFGALNFSIYTTT